MWGKTPKQKHTDQKKDTKKSQQNKIKQQQQQQKTPTRQKAKYLKLNKKKMTFYDSWDKQKKKKTTQPNKHS